MTDGLAFAALEREDFACEVFSSVSSGEKTICQALASLFEFISEDGSAALSLGTFDLDSTVADSGLPTDSFSDFIELYNAIVSKVQLHSKDQPNTKPYKRKMSATNGEVVGTVQIIDATEDSPISPMTEAEKAEAAEQLGELKAASAKGRSKSMRERRLTTDLMKQKEHHEEEVGEEQAEAKPRAPPAREYVAPPEYTPPAALQDGQGKLARSFMMFEAENETPREGMLVAEELDSENARQAVGACNPEVVGTYSCSGMEEASIKAQPDGSHPEPSPRGRVVKINQDCACVVHPFAHTKGAALFCVFDGHGPDGRAVAFEAMHSICHHVLDPAAGGISEREDAKRTIVRAFEQTQLHLRALLANPALGVDASESGACATVALLCGRELTVASVGDCRTVLASRRVDLVSERLSCDHTVELPVERRRIEAAGGCIRTHDADGDAVPPRCYISQDEPWLGPGLRISRAFGDVNAELDGLLIAEPDVFTQYLGGEDEFLIMASDGIWEFVHDDKAVELVSNAAASNSSATAACCALMAHAALTWRRYEGNYRDDITGIVIYLPQLVGDLEELREGEEGC